MPLYEYKCDKCKETFEVLQKIGAEPLSKCVHCKGNVHKLISVSSFRLKGNGWYITDYKNKSKDKSTGEKSVNTTKSSKPAGDSKNAAVK